MRVWVDANADGLSQAAELRTLDSLGIASLDLAARRANEKNAGNWVGLKGGFTRTDGSRAAMDDVWFVLDHQATLAQQASALAGAIAQFDPDAPAADAPALRPATPALTQAQALVAVPLALQDPTLAASPLAWQAQALVAAPLALQAQALTLQAQALAREIGQYAHNDALGLSSTAPLLRARLSDNSHDPPLAIKPG